MIRIFIKSLLLVVLFSTAGYAQKTDNHSKQVDKTQPSTITYKEIDGSKLDLTFRYPPKFKKIKKYPTIIFFFGGGWNGGTVEQFKPQAEYFAERGMITVLADYRVKSRHKTTPYEAAADALSSIRFLRKHAKELNIDADKIVASGGSAGGHLAAVTGVCRTLDEKSEDLSISSKANALVLFNPVFDNGPDGFEHERMGERWKEISPAHNIRKDAPPTIVFLGREDHLIPVSVAENYKAKMDSVGSRCDLFLYDGAGHGFFNNYKYDGKFYTETVRQADRFLKSIGYIKGKPTL
ncbi:alpha/beta hydrolase [uncultured Draconibacterium sp.]|uniref:alpha/beta hydrolase n=1 Tax=uncultured Draconibacterium sp. TaxID=1573823 RepID=UPI0029C78F69|nr:alpha/beta hydrolase [uncultured Draconibacterium sp.]